MSNLNGSQPGAARKRRILVVEDESMLRMLVERILENHGYEVQAAASGDEAVELWRRARGAFDLLLCDMVLPDGRTGWQIAAQLRSERPELKVVYASGFTTDSIGCEGQSLVEGINFLQKPYNSRSLADTLHRCLGRAEALAA